MPERIDALITLIAVLNENDDVLLLKRKPDVHCPDVWSFPGGKIKASETPLDASVRELKEETGLKGRVWRHIGKHSHTYEDRHLAFYFFFCRTAKNIKKDTTLNTESAYMWCPLSELSKQTMPEANQVLVTMLLDCYHEGLCPIP
jgi:8-oxo-dGTP diphosphatase